MFPVPIQKNSKETKNNIKTYFVLFEKNNNVLIGEEERFIRGEQAVSSETFQECTSKRRESLKD